MTDSQESLDNQRPARISLYLGLDPAWDTREWDRPYRADTIGPTPRMKKT